MFAEAERVPTTAAIKSRRRLQTPEQTSPILCSPPFTVCALPYA